MFDGLTEITWWSVALAGLAYYMLGALWFTGLFGGAYDRATGVVRSRTQRWPALYYVGPLVNCLVNSAATAILVHALDVRQMSVAVTLGLIVGVGYSASISLTNAITPNMPKPLLFGAVTGSYHMLGAIIVAVILVALR